MFSNSNSIFTTNGKSEEKWERVYRKTNTYNIRTRQSIRNGFEQRLNSQCSESESDNEETEQYHQNELIKRNGSSNHVKHVHFSETDDEGYEVDGGSVTWESTLRHKSFYFASWIWRSIKTMSFFITVPIYWSLVQSLVFEKWILNRKPSRRRDSPVFTPALRGSGYTFTTTPSSRMDTPLSIQEIRRNTFTTTSSGGETPTFIPPHSCSSRIHQRNIRQSVFDGGNVGASTAKRFVSWQFIFIILLLAMIPLLAYFIGSNESVAGKMDDNWQGIREFWNWKTNSISWPFASIITSEDFEDKIDAETSETCDEMKLHTSSSDKPVVNLDLEEKMTAKITEKFEGFEQMKVSSTASLPLVISNMELEERIDAKIAEKLQLLERLKPTVPITLHPRVMMDLENRFDAKIAKKLHDIEWSRITIPSPRPHVVPDLDEKINAKITEKFADLERIFEERLATVMLQYNLENQGHHQLDHTLKDLKRDVMSYATNLFNSKECTLVCPPPVESYSGHFGSGGGDVEKLIKVALDKYDADKTGRPDLALESGGGSVVSTRCTKKSNYLGSQISIWNIPIWYPANNPRRAIQPGTMPGDCWSFDGAEGFLVIKLVGPTHVTGFTIEHLAKAISPLGHIDSAPRKFQVVGHVDYNDFENEFLFGEYEYLDNGNPIQYFEAQNVSDIFFPYIELKILSNHGNVGFTCLYRFRVHGYLESWTTLLTS